MRAIVITQKGGPEVLKMQDIETPIPTANQVLIKVRAAGVNRSDIMSRSNKSYGTATQGKEIPGLEVSGEIESAGPGVKRWKKGDLVCALVAGGGYATYITVDERLCLPIPEGMSFEDAAALPETIFTVWSNVFKTCGFKPEENFLIHGGTSGIGVMAIQMIVAMGGKAYATAGTKEKCDYCLQLGASLAINYKTEDFVSILKPIGIDVILDMTGGGNTLKNLDILNKNGRLAFINAMNGTKSEIDIRQVMSKGITITGSMLKPQTNDFKAALALQIEEVIWPLIKSGRIKPIVYKVFPLEQAADAQILMESSTHIGKIILNNFLLEK